MSSGTPRSRKRGTTSPIGKSKTDGSKPSSVSLPAQHIEELREQAVSDQKAMLGRLMAERELALKELLLLKQSSSLGCFSPSDPTLLQLVNDYHVRHPLNLDDESAGEEPWSEDDEEEMKITKMDVFPPVLFAHAGLPTPNSAATTKGTTLPNEHATSTTVTTPLSPVSRASPSLPSVSSPKSTVAKQTKSPPAKRAPARPKLVKDEMMPDLAPAPSRLIQTTATALSSPVALTSAQARQKSHSNVVATTKPRTPSTPRPMKPFSSPPPPPVTGASPISAPSTDSALIQAVSYVPFLTKNAGGAISKQRAGFPWTDAELFAGTTSIFQLPTPMATDSAWRTRARQDAAWLEKISTLQKEGKLSTKRLEAVPEPPRNKTHWDFVLREMAWMAADFKQERYWRFEAARKLARAAEKFHVEKARQVVRVQREREKALRDKARWISRQVTAFWHDVEQLIVFKHRSSLDKHKKAAMDKNLDFFVQQTEQYSASLAIDLQAPSATAGATASPLPPSRTSTPLPLANGTPAAANSMDTSKAADDEGLDLDALPDEDFKPTDAHAEEDDEATIAAAEAEIAAETMEMVRESGHADESAMLAAESEIPLEVLLARYGGNLVDQVLDEDDEEGGATRAKKSRAAASLAEGDGDDDAPGDEEPEEDEEGDDEEGALSDEEEGAQFGYDFLARVAAHDPVATEEQHQSDKAKLQAAADEARTLQPTGFTLATASVKTAVPFLLQGTLREYQHIGLDWMVTMYEKKLNGILADEMGLGKTIMTISLLAHLACSGHWGPHLIVVPTSVLLNWEMELKRWCPQLKVLTYFGTPRQRKNKRSGWTKPNAFHVCLTSYKLVLQDAQAFKRMKWFYLILDEAHNIKNYKSQSWQTLLNFRTRRRLLLTGTPLQNNLMELWALMHFLMPHIFQSHKEFKDWFSNPVNSMLEGTSNYSDDLIRRLHSILRPFMLRRLKKDVEKQLPGKFEHIVLCKLSKRQRLLYDEYMATGTVQSTLKGGNYLGVANVLMQLRKVCNHPDLFEGRPILSPFDQPTTLALSAPSPILHLVPSPSAFANDHFYLVPQGSRVGSNFGLKPTSQAQATRSTGPIHTTKGSHASLGKSPATQPSAHLPLPSASHFTQSLTGYEDSEKLLPAAEVFQQTTPTTSSSPVAETLAFKHASLKVNQVPMLGTPFSLQSFTPATFKTSQVHVRNTSAATPTFLAHLAVHPESAIAPTTATASSSRGSSNTRAAAAAAAGNLGSGIPNAALISSPFIASASQAFTQWASDHSSSKQKLSVLGMLNASQIERRITEARQRLDHFAYINELRRNTKPLVVASETVDLLMEDIAILKEHALALRADPSRFFDYSNAANALVMSPEERLEDMRAIIERFVCYIPKARASTPKLNVAHLSSPSESLREKQAMEVLKQEIAPKLELFHAAHGRTQIYFPDKRLIQYDCGKLQTLAVMLRQLKREGHRCLIFTQMTRMLDVLEAFINLHGYTYLRLDGATKVEQRQKMMERFNHDKRVFLFILSTRSGGLGINLVGADTVIFYDTDWNPAMDAQAQDRCHRIGQTREVHIYRLISERTIEENILKKAKQKRQLDNIIKEGNFTTDFFKKVDIREMIKEGPPESSDLQSSGAVSAKPTSSAAAPSDSSSMDIDAPIPARSSTPSLASSTGVKADPNQILIPGTAAAAAATSGQTENTDSFLDNPDMEAALMQAEDVADIEALRAVRREIAQEQKIDDTEGLEDDETPEWEAQLSAVHKMAMRYVELVNPSLDKNALAYAHQQITDETAIWKDEAVKRLKMGRDLWHGKRPQEEAEEEDSEVEDEEGQLAKKPQRKKVKIASDGESDDDDDNDEDEDQDDQDGDQSDQNDDDDDNDLGGSHSQNGNDEDDIEDDESPRDEGEEPEEDEEGGDDQNDAPDGEEEQDQLAVDGSSVSNSTSKRSKKRSRREMQSKTSIEMSQVSDGDELPLFYQVSDSMAAEVEHVYRGAPSQEVPYGSDASKSSANELYLPLSAQLPGVLELLSESSATEGYEHDDDDDDEDSISEDSFTQKKRKMTSFTLNPLLDHYFTPSRTRRRHREPPSNSEGKLPNLFKTNSSKPPLIEFI